MPIFVLIFLRTSMSRHTQTYIEAQQNFIRLLTMIMPVSMPTVCLVATAAEVFHKENGDPMSRT